MGRHLVVGSQLQRERVGDTDTVITKRLIIFIGKLAEKQTYGVASTIGMRTNHDINFVYLCKGNNYIVYSTATIYIADLEKNELHP